MKKGITTVSVFIMVAIIVFLLGTITVSTYSTIQNAKKIAFALEISNIQEEVDRYVKEYGNDTLPISDNVYTIDLADITENSIEQFAGETKNANNEITLYEIDLSVLGIDYTEYGNKENKKDVYALSKETNTVYYLLGVKAKDKTYYTLTQELIDIKERKEKENTETTLTSPVITADGIISKTLSDGTKETYLPNIKVSGKNIKTVKYEVGLIEEDIAKEYFKSNGYTIIGDRINLKYQTSVTLYAENDNGQYTLKYCYGYPLIPEGFVVSIYDGEMEVEDGLVIYKTDSLNGISHEIAMESFDQYVWIPVHDITKFSRTTTYNGTITLPNSSWAEPYSYNATSSDENDLVKEQAEYKAMYESVKKNAGFYIGRYEAGTVTQRNPDVSNGTTDLVVQKNKYVYNFVGWAKSMTETTEDIIRSGINQGKGAVELSRNLYSNLSSVVSTLCYGVQWDAALQFIYNKDSIYPTNSTGKGNYTGDLEETGYYSVNNIYDMAGNVIEWSMESYSTNGRVMRGGYYSISPEMGPASYRPYNIVINNFFDYCGFRVALYLK